MFCHSTNIGVVFSNDEIFLIDSGQSEEDGKLIAETLSSLFPEKKIKAVIQTHSHADHCGGSLYLKKNLETQIWASAESARIMEVPAIIGAIYCGGVSLKEFDIPQFMPPEPIFTDRILTEEKIELDDVFILVVILIFVLILVIVLVLIVILILVEVHISTSLRYAYYYRF